MLTQLNPTVPMEVIGLGKGFALAVIDYSQEHDLLWVVAMDANGEIWTAKNSDVRLLVNWSLGRRNKIEDLDF